MPHANTPVQFKNDLSVPNKFMLAPLTNTQSQEDENYLMKSSAA